MEYLDLQQILGSETEYLLGHTCQKIPRDLIYRPHGQQVVDVFGKSDRSQQVIDNLRKLYETGRLANTGYLSIFPVDQGVEHTAAYSFYHNPLYFDPENVIKLAIEGGANGVASTLGILGLVSKQYADKVPFIVKVTHNELLTYPNKHDQVVFASVQQAANMGALGIGATIYFGSQQSNRQLVEIAQLFEAAHQVGLFTILWCYPRNDSFDREDGDYNEAVDLTSQANYLGVTIEADIIKQKTPTPHRAFPALQFGKYNDEMYNTLLTDHPIDLGRYQVAHCYMGKIPLINSGGESKGADDFREAIRTAVINKRAGGAGLIMGRKIFKKPFSEGIELLQAVQNVYLDPQVTVA
ncbi:MAG: fructose-bisphosphate aldolase, class [Patescibacteria group bacterium]|nr:fructose-bisphosphate aldolase, class [Patescibacteria group bacterium]